MGNNKVGRGVRNKTAKCGRRKGEVVVEKTSVEDAGFTRVDNNCLNLIGWFFFNLRSGWVHSLFLGFGVAVSLCSARFEVLKFFFFLIFS
jgi:hypothetical protein